jgi:polyphenol oxidase
MQNHGFSLRQAAGVSYYSCDALEQVPALRHGFSTRLGGVSLDSEQALNLGAVSWDTAANVEENRRRFLSALGLAPGQLVTVAQTHSAAFHIINGPAHQWNPGTRGDGLVTAEKGIALAVKVADCFPVLIADPRAGLIAAIHAGWRGIVARIVSRTIGGMQRLGADPARLIVAVGPGIRSCCFEVGAEVAAAFDAAFPGSRLIRPHPGRREKSLLDLPLALDIQLDEARVAARNRWDIGLCTACHPADFFSYRRDGSLAGRMLGIICKTP